MLHVQNGEIDAYSNVWRCSRDHLHVTSNTYDGKRVNLNVSTKASPELLDGLSDNAYVSSDGKQWVCKTCDGALCRGNLAVQAKDNGMELDSEPAELSCLNALEQRLISLRVPFMKMVALPSGKQVYTWSCC